MPLRIAESARAMAIRLLLVTLLALLIVGGAEAHVKRSASVAALQVGLRSTGDYTGTVDGIRGPGTRAAVRSLQQRHGLQADGVAGRATRRTLGRLGKPRWGRRTLSAGMRGWDVAVLQFKLAWRGFPSGYFDGAFRASSSRRAAALPGLGRSARRRRRRAGHSRGTATAPGEIATALLQARHRAGRRPFRPASRSLSLGH